MSERRNLPSFSGIFRKGKQEAAEKAMNKADSKQPANKSYLKAMPLRNLSDVDVVKNEVNSGNILILRITPLASKSIEDVKRAVNELTAFASAVGGDIARLGEERIVICPPNVKIWREKTPVSNEPIPTAA